MNSLEAFEKIGMSEGEARGIAKVAVNLLKSGKYSFDDIMEACNMTLEQVRYLDAWLKLEEQNSLSEEEALRAEAEEEYELRHDGGYDDDEFDDYGHVKLSSYIYSDERKVWINEYMLFRQIGLVKSKAALLASFKVLKARDIRHDTKIDVAINMLKIGRLSLEDVSLYSGLDIQTITKIHKRLTAATTPNSDHQ